MWIALGTVGGIILGFLLAWWFDVRFWRKGVPTADELAAIEAKKNAELEEQASERQMFANELARHTLAMENQRAEHEQQQAQYAAECSAELEDSALALAAARAQSDRQAEEFAAALVAAKAKVLDAEQAAQRAKQEAQEEARRHTEQDDYPQPGTQKDLQFINGIGPKLKDTLHAAGIVTFADLADKTVAELQAVLDAAGGRFRLSHPDTWPIQAAMIRDGKYKELHDYLEVS